MKHILAGLLVASATAGTAFADEWGYAGAGAPENWGSLSPDYAVCSAGTQQSPVDLVPGIVADGVRPELSFADVSGVEAERNAHGVTYHVPEGSAHLTLNGQSFDLLQFHFHAESEHWVEGEAYPLEVHFVTASEGKLAVVGVLFERGEANATVDTLWDAIGPAGERRDIDATISLSDLLPQAPSAFRYEGSLTTPPCSEIVSWTVFTTPLSVSDAQIEAFVDAVGENARPPQPLNRRYILLDN